jgi:hypothetical protein
VDRAQAPHAVRLCIGAARSRETLARGLDAVAGLLHSSGASRGAVV